MSDSKRFTNLGSGVYRQYNTWQTKGTSKGKYDMKLENALWDETGVDPRASKTEKQAFISLDIDDSAIRRASLLLAGIKNGFYKSVGSAMKRAAEHGRTVGMNTAGERYTAGTNTLKQYTEISNTIVHEYGSFYEITFGYRGFHIPLMRFNTRVGKDGRVETQVLRNGVQKTLDNAFAGSVMGGKKRLAGVFERIGPSRYPIRQLYGPAATQAFSDDDTQQRIGDAITEKFNERIEHEITRVLNGWGGD